MTHTHDTHDTHDTYENQTVPWTQVDPRRSFTLHEIIKLRDDVEEELKRRGFTPINVTYMVFDEKRHGLSLTVREDNMRYTTAFVGYPNNLELDRLIPTIQMKLDDYFPIPEIYLKNKFNQAFSKLAEIADKLGELIPSYNEFATILRDSRKSNLLEENTSSVQNADAQTEEN